MIRKEELYKIGLFNKPHGVRGELSFTFTDDIFDRMDCDYLVCLFDGIFVPFFIEEYRFRSETTALVKLEGVDTTERARMFTNVEVYFHLHKYVTSDIAREVATWNMSMGAACIHTRNNAVIELSSWEYFIGFTVYCIKEGELGEITDVDDSTANVVFAIDHKGKELLVPAHEEFIVDIDRMHKTMTMDLPEGLYEL